MWRARFVARIDWYGGSLTNLGWNFIVFLARTFSTLGLSYSCADNEQLAEWRFVCVVVKDLNSWPNTVRCFFKKNGVMVTFLLHVPKRNLNSWVEVDPTLERVSGRTTTPSRRAWTRWSRRSWSPSGAATTWRRAASQRDGRTEHPYVTSANFFWIVFPGCCWLHYNEFDLI